jgi:hypothetical protein
VFWPYCAAVVSLAVAIAAFWKPAARASGLDRLRALAPAAYAIPLVIFGADHLSSVKEVMRIVPSWMPGKMFWTIFVGAALIFEAMSSVQDRPRELVIRTQEGEDDRVVITVQDTGIGLDPKITEQMFDAFYTTKGEGMGLRSPREPPTQPPAQNGMTGTPGLDRRLPAARAAGWPPWALTSGAVPAAPPLSQFSICAMSAAPLAGRWAGSFSRHHITTVLIPSGSSERRARIGSGTVPIWPISICTSDSAWMGSSPVQHLIHHHAQRVKVGAAIQALAGLAHGLLRPAAQIERHKHRGENNEAPGGHPFKPAGDHANRYPSPARPTTCSAEILEASSDMPMNGHRKVARPGSIFGCVAAGSRLPKGHVETANRIVPRTTRRSRIVRDD